ncbi:MAG: Stp1/IreP family PP2C-type Ser/Thr phosphatase [Myxococcota bacterium]
MKLQYAGATHVGMKRDHNEDNLMLAPEMNLFVVADGMGGHASGEVASRIAVDTLKQFFEETEADDDITWPYKMDRGLSYDENRLVAAIKLANRNIFETALDDVRLKGMGTTFVGFLVTEEHALVAHVGDSRCYRVRGGEIEEITEDHSLLNDYKKIQKMTPEEEAAFPHKNIIVRALGMKETVDVDIQRQTPQDGDILLLCSDGLNGELEDDEIRDIVLRHQDDLDQGVEALIQAACDHGGKDNVTVAMVKYVEA